MVHDVVWSDVEWDTGCVTVLPHHALPHHSSIIPHLTAQHSTLHHISSCNTVHTMLCHTVPPHTAHPVRCGVLYHVFCDMEWACGMWCGAIWNVLQWYHTMICHSTPPHTTQHSYWFPRCTTPQQHNSTSHCTAFHISSCYTVQTTLCHITLPHMACDVMRYGVMCHVTWNGAWSGVWNEMLHITQHALPHHTTAYCTSQLHICMAQPHYL